MMAQSSTQSRSASLVEAVTNVAVGYVLALFVQQLVFPVFGLHIGMAGHGAIAAIFTVVSLARSYLLRRLFTAIEAARIEEQEQRASRLVLRMTSRSR